MLTNRAPPKKDDSEIITSEAVSVAQAMGLPASGTAPSEGKGVGQGQTNATRTPRRRVCYVLASPRRRRTPATTTPSLAERITQAGDFTTGAGSSSRPAHPTGSPSHQEEGGPRSKCNLCSRGGMPSGQGPRTASTPTTKGKPRPSALDEGAGGAAPAPYSPPPKCFGAMTRERPLALLPPKLARPLRPTRASLPRRLTSRTRPLSRSRIGKPTAG